MPLVTVTAKTSAVQAATMNLQNRVGIALINLSTTITVFFGFDDTVTASGTKVGTPLLPGQSVGMSGPQAIWVITDSGTASVSVTEERKDGS